MGLFNRRAANTESIEPTNHQDLHFAHQAAKVPTASNPAAKHVLPTYNHNGHLVTKGIHPDGESGRSGVHPVHFCKVAWRSTSRASKLVNILWPFVPAAIVLHFARPDLHVWIFAINYIAMVPAANLLGFAGQELARKLPKVGGILLETALGSVVEIVLFMVLIKKDNGTGDVTTPGDLIPVIQAAILGSILTNLLLCLGMCFFVGGLKRKEQVFHAAISEVGSGLLLVAGFALLIPSAFFSALAGVTVPAGSAAGYTEAHLRQDTRKISQATSIILLVAFCVYMIFNTSSHDSFMAEALEHDEEKDEDRPDDLAKAKFTLTECVVAILIVSNCLSLVYWLVLY